LIVGLHGFTLNGAVMRAGMQELIAAVDVDADGGSARWTFPDGPHACAPATVRRMESLLGGRTSPPPHRGWWDASDDGRIYDGWEASRALLGPLLVGPTPVGLIGFSQGAVLAAALAALAERGQSPPLRFVVLVAGHVPRDETLRPLFERPLSLPSLHVWGEKDELMAPHSAALADCFVPDRRETSVWAGPHVIPTRGPGAQAIVKFLRRHSANAGESLRSGSP
jgi:predicted esterase